MQVSLPCFSFCAGDLSAGLKNFGRVSEMSILYLTGGIIALALLIYLFIALLKPEVFS
jgi:K+-transporting ATPase KdpF subunit